VLGARLRAALAGLGELVEKTLQVLINTLSFARVGAFALAHAGLASAVVALAEAAGHGIGFVVVLVLGNVLIIAIEGLIVSIQTTRLVLFEFFTRFFSPEGRAFRPLAPPPVTVKES
jgi:V/A-type H+-transporting ATPase subunit I